MSRMLLLAVFCCALGLPAAGQETVAATEAPASSDKTFEIPNPAMADEARQPLQSLVVIVDGEARSWAPLEKGTDVAWMAYRDGKFPQAVPVFARLAELGHPVAAWLMGNIYSFCQGVAQGDAE